MATKLRVVYEPKGRAREYAPLAVSLYRGCGHGCAAKYCYAPTVLKMSRAEFLCPVPRKGVLAKLKRDAADLEAAGDERPIMMSFTCDPYQQLDDELQLTRQGITILKEHGCNVEILTKGGLKAERDFELLGDGDAFAATLTFSNTEDSLKWEPNAAVPEDRLHALGIAHDVHGLRTWASMEPVIDPAQSLEMIDMSLMDGLVDLYKLGAWNYDKRAKEINWVRYYDAAVALIEAAGKKYIVKDDLKKLVDENR